jgi:hypothetical protein
MPVSGMLRTLAQCCAIPSLATTFSITYRPSQRQFHSNSFQLNGTGRLASSESPSRIAASSFSISPVPSTNLTTLWRFQNGHSDKRNEWECRPARSLSAHHIPKMHKL